MKRTRNITSLSIFILILLIFFPGDSVAKERKLLKTKLPNGLSVIIEEDHRAPVVALQMWVRVGSADESEREAGIAHVFEHMLFKGTSRRKVGELAQEVESAGGYINAYTSYDQTVYHLALASRYFDIGLDILSDAVQNSSFDPTELTKELEVVFEEIRRGEDSPSRKLFSSLMESAFSTHTYRRPVIGFNTTVGSLTRADILAFFEKWYVPNNMTLVIVGDVESEKTLQSIKETFKGFKKRRDPHSPRPIEPKQKETRVRVVAQPITQSRIALGFHITGLKHDDTYALDLASVILGHGKSSRLFREIKVQSELVDSISASSMTPKDPGLFIIKALLDAEDIDKATTAILKEVQELSTKGPTAKEMKKALLALESDFIFERETMEGKASQLGYYDTVSGDITFEEKYIAGIRGVRQTDIMRVLKKYLTHENMTAIVLLNKEKAALINDASLSALIKKATADIDIITQNTKESAKEEGARLIKLKNGITLILKKQESNPTVAFYATFPGGLRSETKKTNGIGLFTASMLSRGTERWNAIELAEEIESMSGSISAFSGNNTIGIKGVFLSNDFDRGLDIITEMLLNHTLPPKEIEKLKEDIIAAIKRDADNLAGHTFELLRLVLYLDHPYSLPIKGTPKTVASFKRRDIKKHIKKHFLLEQMVFAIVGDFDLEHAEEKIEALFPSSKSKRRPSRIRSPGKSAPQINEGGIRTTGKIRDKSQTHIAIGFPGTTILSEDSLHLSILDEVLSGQGGRLFVELRDTQSLAYVTSAFSSPGVDPGLFGVYIGTAPEKKDRAIEEMIKVLRVIRETGITDAELERAKSSIIGSYEIGLQSVLSQATDMAVNEQLELGYDFSSKYPEKINGVTKQDVLTAARKYLTLDSYVISIVGPNGPDR